MTTQDPTHHQTAPDWTSRFIRSLAGRRAIAAGIAFWAAALIELLFYVNGFGIHSAVQFALLEIWLLSAGCGGSPILAIRALGRYLSAQTCLLLGLTSGGCAVLLTGLTLGGRMHPSPLAITFSLVPLLAFSIHCVNGAEAQHNTTRLNTRIRRLENDNIELTRAVRALSEALECAREESETAFYDGRRRGLELSRDAALARLEALAGKQIPIAALQDCYERMNAVLGSDPTEPSAPLHIVEAPENTDTGELPQPSKVLAFRRLARDETWSAPPEIRQSGANGHRAPGT